MFYCSYSISKYFEMSPRYNQHHHHTISFLCVCVILLCYDGCATINSTKMPHNSPTSAGQQQESKECFPPYYYAAAGADDDATITRCTRSVAACLLSVYIHNNISLLYECGRIYVKHSLRIYIEI